MFRAARHLADPHLIEQMVAAGIESDADRARYGELLKMTRGVLK